MSAIKLSILIPSLFERRESRIKLIQCLQEQARASQGIQIVIDIDNREQNASAKRNNLLRAAKGDYVCFVDDDDQVPDYYIAEILKAIEGNPDVVGFSGMYFKNGIEQKPFVHSIQYDRWYDDARAYYRCPTPLNPVKRELAVAVGFNEAKAYCEDHDYSLRLRPLLKTETFIDKTMYLYYFDSRKSVCEQKRKVG